MKRHLFIVTAALCSFVLLLLLASPVDRNLSSSAADSRAARNPDDFDTVRTNLHDYIWPTDASRRVTSSFAEYRTYHFHGGIDISTNQVTGYKVFAVRDGYVYRIAISPNGYGKMLYVRHPDGYVSTYAHLKTFNSEINRVAREEQYRRGTYAIELTLDSLRLPVKQGEVIAYTGNTGFGPPHLHFELRDQDLNPVNPMLSEAYDVEDNIPPTIRRVMLEPLSYGSTIDNSREPRYFSRFPRRGRLLTIPQEIRIHGQAGFGVEAEDKSNGSWSREGIHRLDLFIDDSLAYSMELDRVLAEEMKLIDLHYDLPSIERGRGRFQKLYVDVGNSLPFYFHKPEGTGVINTDRLSEGSHNYRIVCSDNAGNKTELTGELFANHKPDLSIKSIDNGEMILTGKDVPSVARFFVYGKRAFQPSWSQHTLSKGRFDVRGSEVVLPVNTKPYDVLKVTAETKSGSQSSPMFYFLKKPFGPPKSVRIESEVMDNYVQFIVTTPGVFTATPVLSIQEGTAKRMVSLDAVAVNRYVGAYTPSDTMVGKRIVQVDAEVNGKPASATDEVVFYSIPTNISGKFSIDGRTLTISYDSGAVFKPLYLQVRSEDFRRSTVYSLEPDDVLLNGGIRVSIPVDADASNEHLGLYYRSRGGWIFQTGQPDSGGRAFSTKLNRRLGELTVMQDDVPPTIGRLRVRSGRGAVDVSFRYFDNLSGVDPDEIKMYLDDKLVIPEIDGEHHLVSFRNDEPIGWGRHSLRIAMRDRAKNATEASRTFTVR